MSREIKFRAWDGEQMINPPDGYMFDATVIATSNNKGITLNLFRRKKIELMQFTGLKDKNGKDIYEGDIVKCHDHPTGVDDVTSYVEFKYGSFIIAYNALTLSNYGTAWTEVLGNIYENAELITTPQTGA